MPAQLPFHFGPALRPISHGNPAGPGNPLFHRTARVFGQAISFPFPEDTNDFPVYPTFQLGPANVSRASIPIPGTGPTTPGADQTGATVSTTPPTTAPASPPVVPSSSSYFTAPVLIGAALLYWLLLK